MPNEIGRAGHTASAAAVAVANCDGCAAGVIGVSVCATQAEAAGCAKKVQSAGDNFAGVEVEGADVQDVRAGSQADVGVPPVIAAIPARSLEIQRTDGNVV